jgi:hypothetical protein
MPLSASGLALWGYHFEIKLQGMFPFREGWGLRHATGWTVPHQCDETIRRIVLEDEDEDEDEDEGCLFVGLDSLGWFWVGAYATQAQSPAPRPWAVLEHIHDNAARIESNIAQFSYSGCRLHLYPRPCSRR